MTCNHSTMLDKFLCPIPGNGHEMTFKLVPGANFSGVLHHFVELDPLEWVSWPSLAENARKMKIKFEFLFLGMIAYLSFWMEGPCRSSPSGFGKLAVADSLRGTF